MATGQTTAFHGRLARQGAMIARPLRVLAFTPLYRPFLGGIEIFIENTAPALRAHSIDVAVVTESSAGLPERETMNATRVYRLPLAAALASRKPADPLKVMHDLRAIMKDERPDAIHMHSLAQAASFYVDRITSEPGAWPPLVVTLHGAMTEDDKIGMVLRLLGRAKAVSGVSRACLASLEGMVPDGAPKHLIYNGIPAAKHEASPWRKGETAQLLCVGRWRPEKGYDLAIRALRVALQRGFDGHLSLIGSGVEEQNWRALAVSLGIAERVTFSGQLQPDEVERRMAASHTIIAPSRVREGFGLVVAEAGQMGVPAVVADTGGLPEVVANGVTGIIVPRDNVEAIADALLKLFDSEAGWLGYSTAVRQHVRERFGFDRCISGYVKLYDEHVGREDRAL